MKEMRSRDWLWKRKQELTLQWCDTQFDLYRLSAPQSRWAFVGEQVAKFNQALGRLHQFWDKVSKSPQLLAGDLQSQLIDVATELMWTGESLVLMSPGLENTRKCHRFLGGIPPAKHFYEQSKNPSALWVFLRSFVRACDEFSEGITEYLEEFDSVVDVPDVPRVSQLVDVGDFLYEARDLLSLGYTQTALFILVRTIETVFKAAVRRLAFNLNGDESVKTFDDIVTHLSTIPPKGLPRPLISAPMKAMLDNLRRNRNLLAHSDSLEDEFFADTSPDLARLAIRVLIHFDRSLREAESLLQP